MLSQNEMLTLLLGVGTGVFLALSRHRLRRVAGLRLFLMAYSLLVLSWLATNLEAVMVADVLNLLEHACYLGATVLLACWCWRTFGGQPRRGAHP